MRSTGMREACMACNLSHPCALDVGLADAAIALASRSTDLVR
jgi:hypothetical protein